MLFPHTPVVYPSQYRRDSDGNTVRWPGDEGEPVPAYVQPRESVPSGAGAAQGGPSQQGSVEAVAYLSRFCPAIDRFSALEWDGWRWAFVSDPLDQRNPDGSVRMWRAEIRRDVRLADGSRHG